MSRRQRASLLSWACVLLSLVGLIRAHAMFLAPAGPLHVFDEGYINAFAARMVDGRFLPYVDAVSHRGPLLYWIVAAAVWLGGTGSWLPIRLCALFAGVLALLFTFVAGRAAGKPFAGALGALGCALVAVIVFGPMDGMSFNGEHALNVFATAGLYAVVRGLARRRGDERPRLGWIAAAGVCAGLSALSKQNGAVMVPTLGAWVLAAAIARPELDRGARWKMVGLFSVAVVAPLVSTAVIYALAGELDTLRYYAIAYNREIYMGPFTAARLVPAVRQFLTDRALLLSAALALCGWGLAPLVLARPLAALPRRWDRDGFTATVALGALLSLVASNASMRGFTHYFVQLVPWFALLTGLVFERIVGPRRQLWRALLVTPALILLLVGWTWTRKHHRRGQQRMRRAASASCRVVDRLAPAGQPLFTWGFQADLYTWCHRKPASRFVFTTFVAGVVPWFEMKPEEEEAFSVPGSRALLIEELERSRPLIIDAPKSMQGRSIMRYRELALYMRAHYCHAERLGALAFYVRRGADGRCPGEQPSERKPPRR